jgi:hypothetical protein
MKTAAWLMTSVPALLIAGTSSAQANGLDDLWCKLFGIGCSPSGGGGGTSVSEPEMIGLFCTGLIVAGLAAYKRARK